MTDPLADVGVVLVTHNSAEYVSRALQSLPVKHLGGVVVVDNASTDDTVDVVERHAPGVQVVRAPNDGFGAGCNRGLQALPQVGHVLFLNPDAVLEEPDLRILVAYLREHPVAALVAPRLWQGDRPLTSAGALATTRSELAFALPPRLARLVPDRRLPAEWDRSGAVGVVEGACMLIDAAALREVGAFDERYFLFFEEHDLSRRLQARGREVHLCAQARAQHAVGASRAAIPLAGHDHYWYSTLLYLRSWAPAGGARLVGMALRLNLAWSVLRGRLTRADAARVRAVLSAPRPGGSPP